MKSIVEIAVDDDRFSTLVTALDAAGLVDTLSGEGPFTVFAPTDDAFAKLPEGTVESLLENTDALRDVLLYHVAPGKVMSSEVVKLSSADTALGAPLSISMMGDRVMINEAEVVIADIEASNGVIHVVDSVILPPADEPDIVSIAVDDGRFTTLVTALKAADLVGTLQGEGPFTVFAPTDDAFARLPEGTVDALLGDIPTLKNILLYHVVPGSVTSSEVVKLNSAGTASGEMIKIQMNGNRVMLNDAEVIIVDIKASNGVIHVIDRVILPPSA
jgi:transforming growth factor-beta-induced protein